MIATKFLRILVRRRSPAALVLLALGALAAGPPAAPASALAPLTPAFTDDVYFDAPAVQVPWIQRTVAANAGLVLLDIYWSGIAPRAPAAGFDATNPADPGYDWSGIDYAVRALASAGVEPALMITGAPTWAEGRGRPSDARPGTWRPDATAYGRFAAAAAKRYSGAFPDPGRPGQALPRVRYWQAWAEPNLYIHLAPQWARAGKRLVPASPAIYRKLLNAFYAGIKSVDPGNVVVTAGTAPFGDTPGGRRLAPAVFVRELLCLQGPRLRPQPCPDPAHFDVLAHHPYEVGVPTTTALNPDDVTAPDLAKLTHPLKRAVALGRALPRAHKRVWVTEFSYDSRPPNPQAVSTATQARWLEQAFYIFWRQGVDTVVWYLIRDQAPIPSYAAAYESGVYLRDGTPKPSLQAFRFPFVIESANTRSPTAWGRAPEAGTVAIQRAKGSGWQTIARLPAAGGAVFERRLRGVNRGSFRALIGADASLVWRQP